MTLSPELPRTQWNELEKTCMSSCLFTEPRTHKIILFLLFIGSFDDTDLYNGDLPRGGGGGGGGGGKIVVSSQGAIAGIVSAVVATVIGAVSSFIAYQKKKLCFKQRADEENVNMDSHRGAQSEPPGKRRI
uniref:CD99 molecule (Xg blood group) n=1 Tax=Anas platyrhynchos platyrhynchos TaxID=8840 RepID=U3IUQ6_ANAPP